MKRRAKQLLCSYTAKALADLRHDEDEMLRGVDWLDVAECVDLSADLQKLLRTGGA